MIKYFKKKERKKERNIYKIILRAKLNYFIRNNQRTKKTKIK